MDSNRDDHFSAAHRLMHWAAAFLMCVLFLTGFLRMTWMSKSSVAIAIERGVASVEVTKEQKSAVAKELRHSMWEWHERAALLMVVIIGARLIYMARRGLRFPNPFNKKHTFKERMQGNIYLLFYLLVLVQITTGMYIQFVNGSLKDPFEDIHKLAIIWFPIFIVMHLSGIVLAELSEKKGVVSDMIAGSRSKLEAKL